jgi:hypothetical protein
MTKSEWRCITWKREWGAAAIELQCAPMTMANSTFHLPIQIARPPTSYFWESSDIYKSGV